MKVALLTMGPYPHIGGKSSHISMVHRGLRELGVEADVISSSSISAPGRLLLSDGPRVALDAVLRGRGLLWSYRVRARLLARLLQGGSYDLIHCHDVPAQLAVGSAWAKASAHQPPTVLTVHGDITNECVSEGKLSLGTSPHRALLKQEAAAYRAASIVIAVDSRLRGHVATLSGRTDTRVMPNFVDTAEFRPIAPCAAAGDALGDDALVRARDAWRDRIARAAGSLTPFVFLCPRRLVPKNGVEVAIRALAWTQGRRRLEQHGVPILVCAGDGPLRSHLGQLARGLGVESQLVFLGDIAHCDMPGLYAASDVVVIPSVASHGVIEATSISALEALASGLPVLVSAIGGLAELIQDGDNGLVFPQGDAEALGSAMLDLVDSPASRQRLGAAARSTAVCRHSYLTGCEHLLEVYKQARGLGGR